MNLNEIIFCFLFLVCYLEAGMKSKLTGDVELGDGRDDAFVVVSFAHELAGVVRKDFAQHQDGRAIFQVIDTEIFGRLDLFTVQIPKDGRFWITFHFHLESVQCRNLLF